MKITLHIGSLKTGSTFLQRVIWDNKPVFSDAGILVPNAGAQSQHHYSLACALGFSDGAKGAETNDGVLQAVRQEIEQSRSAYALLSSEHFDIRANEANVTRTARFFADHEVHVVIYLRPQVDLAQSVYFESVKWGNSSSFDRFLETYSKLGNFDYLSKVRRWRHAGFFVTAIDYEAAKSSLLPSFLSELPAAVDMDRLSLPRKKINETLSPEATEYLRLLNASQPSGRGNRCIYNGFFKLLQQMDGKWTRPRPIPLPPRFVATLPEMDASNRRLAEELGKASGFLGRDLADDLRYGAVASPLDMEAFYSDLEIVRSRTRLLGADLTTDVEPRGAPHLSRGSHHVSPAVRDEDAVDSRV